MIIKAYIECFSEISKLDRSQQYKLLEQSESHANKKFGLPIFKLIAILVPICVLALFIGIGYWLLGMPNWSLLLVTVVALLISRVIVSEVNIRILYNSLLIVLQEDKSNTGHERDS